MRLIQHMSYALSCIFIIRVWLRPPTCKSPQQSVEQIWRTLPGAAEETTVTATCHWERNNRRNADIWTGSSTEPRKTTKSGSVHSWIALETLIKLAFMREISIRHCWGDPVTGWTTESLKTAVCPCFSHESSRFLTDNNKHRANIGFRLHFILKIWKKTRKTLQNEIWSRH